MSLDSNFTISQRADTAIRRAATVVLLIVGVSSAILSYAGLRHLAIMAGIVDSLSFLFPIVVDGMILLGSLSVLRAALARMSTWFGWMLTILGTVTSIAGNILSVENANLVSQIIHSVPPVFLCLSLETFIQLLRHRIKNTYVSEGKNSVMKDSEYPVSNADIELSLPATPVVIEQKESPAVTPDPPVSAATTPAPVPVVAPAQARAITPPAVEVTETTVEPVANVPEPVAEPVQDEKPSAPITVQEPVAVNNPVVAAARVEAPADALLTSKPVKIVPAPAVPVAAEKPVVPRPKPTRPQPSAAPSETVELYRIILEDLDADLTKTQRIAEILRVYPDARIGDLREALGDEPTLRIDGSVRRAKELLKNGK